MNTKALVWAAALTIALVALVTIGSELSASLKQFLSSISGHHWIGKSVLSLVFFGVLYMLFSKLSEDSFSLKDTWLLIGSVVVSGLAILVFYFQHA